MIMKRFWGLTGAAFAIVQTSFAEVDWTTSPVVINEGAKDNPIVVDGATTNAIASLEITSTGALKLTDAAAIKMSDAPQKVNGYLELNDSALFDSAKGLVAIGNSEGDSGEVVVNGGVFKFYDAAAGNAGYGHFVLNGGSVCSQTTGSDGHDDFCIGKAATGEGLVEVSGGAFGVFRSITIGAAGKGKLVLTGGSASSSKYMFMGRSSGSQGTLILNGGSVTGTGTSQSIFAEYGTATIVVSSGTFSCGTVIFARYAGSKARLVIYEGCSMGGQNATQVYGEYGDCEVQLYGGLLKKSGTGAASYHVGQNGSNSVLRGWGSTDWGKKITLNNNGCVIADGTDDQGVVSERMLMLAATGDESFFGNTLENTTTSGWYAVNRGLLSVQIKAAVPAGETGVYTWGEAEADDEIDLVNSARVTFKNITDTSTKQKGIYSFTGKLYASDRGDVPAGLPAGKTIAGIWKFDINGAYESADVEFRYDHVLAPKGVTLYQYDGTAWVKLAATALPNHRAKVEDVDPTKMFAAVAETSGLIVSLQ